MPGNVTGGTTARPQRWKVWSEADARLASSLQEQQRRSRQLNEEAAAARAKEETAKREAAAKKAEAEAKAKAGTSGGDLCCL